MTSDGIDYIDAADWLVKEGSTAKFLPGKAPGLGFITAGAMLLSEINIAYYQSLMQDARDAIAAGVLAEFSDGIREAWGRGDLPPS